MLAACTSVTYTSYASTLSGFASKHQNTSKPIENNVFMHAVSFSRQQVGIESVTIEFPLTPYKGMGKEAGYNAVYFWSAVHCWVKNVAIINADMAVALDGTHFCTVRRMLTERAATLNMCVGQLCEARPNL